MEIIRVRSIDSLLNRLTQLAVPSDHSDHVFRGHNSESWKLTSTFSRYSNSPLYENRALAFQTLIARFENNLSALGDNPMVDMSLRGKLEFARHNGVPSPLIDFSYSPLVALWFAFNGIRGSVQREPVSIHVLNVTNLGLGLTRVLESIGVDDDFSRERYGGLLYGTFRWERPNFFDRGFPLQMLKFMPLAASWNTKMQRQSGCFLYDNLIYERFNCNCLEDLICEHPDMRRINENHPILTKYVIPTRLAGRVFDILDLYGISGTYLYNDMYGAASDAYNSFNYTTRRQAWDINSDHDQEY